MAAILWTFPNVFSSIIFLIEILLKFLPKGAIDNKSAMV